MQPSDVIQHIVSGALWVAGPSFLGFIGAVLGGVLLTQRKSVAGPLGALAVVAPAFLSVALGVWFFAGAAGADFDDGLLAVSGGLGARFAMLVCAPGLALTLGGFAAFAGARGSDRSWASGAAVAVLGLGAAAVPLAYAVQYSDWVHPSVRAMLYGGLAVVTAVAALGSEPEEGRGPEAASMAGVGFAWAVACVEASLLAMAYVFLVKNAPSAANSEVYVTENVASVIGSLQTWSLATVGVAVLAGVAGQVPSLRHGRVVGGIAGIGMCLAALAVVLLGFPSEALLVELLAGR